MPLKNVLNSGVQLSSTELLYPLRGTLTPEGRDHVWPRSCVCAASSMALRAHTSDLELQATSELFVFAGIFTFFVVLIVRLNSCWENRNRKSTRTLLRCNQG